MGHLIHKQYIHAGKGITLTKVIQKMTEQPRQTCNDIIAKGGAYFGKLRCKNPQKIIEENDCIQVYYRLPFQKENVPFQSKWIVKKNEQFTVACKPSGIPTQGRRDGDSMAFYEILKQNTNGYLGLHHRLDQATSGLMVFCRQKKLNIEFARLFQEHLIKKSYIAVCTGSWQAPGPILEVYHPIGRLHDKKGKGPAFGKTTSGKKAHTTFELIGEDKGQMLIKATPHTGRTHQIRIHASLEGFPLIGDDLYGTKLPEQSFLLHAYHLSWPTLDKLESGSFLVLPDERWQPLLSKQLGNILIEWSAKCQES